VRGCFLRTCHLIIVSSLWAGQNLKELAPEALRAAVREEASQPFALLAQICRHHPIHQPGREKSALVFAVEVAKLAGPRGFPRRAQAGASPCDALKAAARGRSEIERKPKFPRAATKTGDCDCQRGAQTIGTTIGTVPPKCLSLLAV
jgi:hypothetical protein